MRTKYNESRNERATASEIRSRVVAITAGDSSFPAKMWKETTQAYDNSFFFSAFFLFCLVNVTAKLFNLVTWIGTYD